MVPGSNSNNLIIENLQENDSGEYKCRASHNGTPLFNSETSVRINVKNSELKFFFNECEKLNEV